MKAQHLDEGLEGQQMANAGFHFALGESFANSCEGMWLSWRWDRMLSKSHV